MKSSTSLLFILIFTLLVMGCDRYNPFNQYDEQHRPQYHFSPPVNWMGAPGALVYYSGEYHLFYLQNRSDKTPETKSWGHAVSRDLVKWEFLSSAIASQDDNEGIFPGSIVVDWENTASFSQPEAEPPMVAIYTSGWQDNGSESLEQRIAYSTDNGRTWTNSEQNPEFDEYEGDLRDPKVFWYSPSSCWIMALVHPEEQKIRFYSSENLKEWHFQSEFGDEQSDDIQWERPELFELPVDGDESQLYWVLQVNEQRESEFARSGARYFIGDFNGKEFVQEPEMKEESGWVDYGGDFFGAVSYSNISASDNRQIWSGWMNNWKYAENIPTHPWQGAMTIFREVMLKKIDDQIKLVQQPVVELRELRTKRDRFRNRSVNEESNFLRETGITGRSSVLIAEFEPGDATYVGFEVRKGENERTIVGYDSENEELFLDRTESGSHHFYPGFAERYTAPLKPRNGKIKMRIFLDRSSVEVFGNEGNAVITAQVFPEEQSDKMALYVREGKAKLVSLDIWQMESIW